MSKQNNNEKALQTISNIHRNLAIITAILLLTGQITIMGVFVTPRGFRVTLAGPITGIRRIESPTGNPIVNLGIDIIDIFIAKFLLLDQFSVTGSALTPEGFTINCGGPLLGVPRVKAKIPRIQNLFNDLDNFNKLVCDIFNIDPSVANKYKKR
ncbi:hypothetical protein QA612_07045 [Evansella sp. AB-P1]|uniref:hypothetical protein n=1 Tax=Evansella sp. AB-P1 TaxID=3037653 RepID=UPI00241DAA66|nr:hypothetical protein [Evansella sp. AB-P1]MDG5787245.1 hypothetical protein [Evansella sp. AB-P1]